MNIQRILLTGDDGYNSIGTRLLIRALKDKYDLRIAATKTQQSGVGGKLSLKSGGTWGEDVVDGVPAFWVDGTPADVMECAQAYYEEPFDLLISGVNMGPNASTAVISSGTVGAAIRGLGVGVAPHSIAISWDAPVEFWLKDHNHSEDISEYFAYPGDTLGSLIEFCLQNQMWDVNFLNVNIPVRHTKEVRFTKFLKDITRYFSYPITVDRETHTFSYQGNPFNIQEKHLRYDVAALEQGYISITPAVADFTHFETFQRLVDTTAQLP